LKQLNRLISDQDIFGLRTIRVPVKRYGIVEELVRAEMEEDKSDLTLGEVVFMKNEYLYVTSINLNQRLMVSNIDSTADCYLVSYSCHPVCVTINQTIKMAGQSQRFFRRGG